MRLPSKRSRLQGPAKGFSNGAEAKKLSSKVSTSRPLNARAPIGPYNHIAKVALFIRCGTSPFESF
jgi:hypothetical protein